MYAGWLHIPEKKKKEKKKLGSLSLQIFQCNMTNNNHLSQAFIESVAGFVAGVASTLVTHPLDLIKTRLQGKQDQIQYGYTCGEFRV